MTDHRPENEQVSLEDLPSKLRNKLSENEQSALLNSSGDARVAPSILIHRRRATRKILNSLEDIDNQISRPVLVLIKIFAYELTRPRQQSAEALFDIEAISRQICHSIIETMADQHVYQIAERLNQSEAVTLFSTLVPATTTNRQADIRHWSFKLLAELIVYNPNIISNIEFSKKKELTTTAINQLDAIEGVPRLVAESENYPTEYYIIKLVGLISSISDQAVLSDTELDELVSVASDSNSLEVQLWAVLGKFGVHNRDEDSPTIDEVVNYLCPPESDHGVDYYDEALEFLIDILKIELLPPRHSNAVLEAVTDIVQHRPAGMFRFLRVELAFDVLLELVKRYTLSLSEIDAIRSIFVQMAWESSGSYGEVTREVVSSKLNRLEQVNNKTQTWYFDKITSLRDDLRAEEKETKQRALKAGCVLATHDHIEANVRVEFTKQICQMLQSGVTPQRRVAISIKEMVDFGGLTTRQFQILFDTVQEHINSPAENVTNYVLKVYQQTDYLTPSQAESAFNDLMTMIQVDNDLIQNSALSAILTLHNQKLISNPSLAKEVETLCSIPDPGLGRSAWLKILDYLVEANCIDDKHAEMIHETLWNIVQPVVSDKSDSQVEFKAEAGQACGTLTKILLADYSVSTSNDELIQRICAVCANSDNRPSGETATHAIQAINILIESDMLSNPERKIAVDSLCSALHVGGAQTAQSAVEVLQNALATGVEATTIAESFLPITEAQFQRDSSDVDSIFASFVPRSTKPPEGETNQENAEKWDAIAPLLHTLAKNDPTLVAQTESHLSHALCDLNLNVSTRTNCVSILSVLPPSTATDHS